MLRDDVKSALRISNSNTSFDTEVDDLIETARRILKVSGISPSMVDATDNVDPLIIRAIKTYAKAEFGYDNPDAEKFKKSFESLKDHMSMSGDYHEVE